MAIGNNVRCAENDAFTVATTSLIYRFMVLSKAACAAVASLALLLGQPRAIIARKRVREMEGGKDHSLTVRVAMQRTKERKGWKVENPK